MNALKEMVFISEIVLQAKIVKSAYEHLQLNDSNSNHIETWRSIQSILVATGNISKILWPHNSYKSRGVALRNMLNINIDNPLSNRKFRNHFEHYDERIEKWFDESNSSSYIDLSINPSLRQLFPNNTNNRGYNSFNKTLIFRGEIFDIKEILNEIDFIINKCKNFTLV